jgi:hypothetical protein
MGTWITRASRLLVAGLLLVLFISRSSGAEERVLELINEHRAAAGLTPLVRVAELEAAALGHSQDMAGGDFMSHAGSNGSSAGQRITAAGYRWTRYGENVAVGYPSAESVVAAWMQSPGHRANILNAAFRHMGAAVVFRADGRYGYYWTLDLASGAPRTVTPPPSNPLPPTPTLPSITLLAPASGRVGTSVTLQGAGFGTTRGTVRFNGRAAATTSWSDSRIVATVPAGATTGPVSVTSTAGTTIGPSFQVTTASVPTTTLPRLLSLSLSLSAQGATAVLGGENLGATQGSSRVYVRRTNGSTTLTPTVIEWSAGRVVVRLPTLSVGSYTLWVRRGDGRLSNTVGFTIR